MIREENCAASGPQFFHLRVCVALDGNELVLLRTSYPPEHDGHRSAHPEPCTRLRLFFAPFSFRVTTAFP